MQTKSLARLPLLSFILAVLVILLAGFWLYHNQEMHLKKSAEQELWAIANLKADQISNWRSDLENHAEAITNSPFFTDTVVHWINSPRHETAEPILKRFEIQKRFFDHLNVALLDKKGHVLLSLDNKTAAPHQEVAQALARAFETGKPAITDLHGGDSGVKPHIGVVSLIYAKSGNAGKPVGALVIQTAADRFLYPLIQSWPVPSKTAETLLVRKDGDSVLFLNELRHTKNTALKLRIPLSRTDVPAVAAALGREGIFTGYDYRGVPVLSALKAIRGSPWFMVAKADQSEVFAAWRNHSYFILAVIFLMITAAAGLAGMAIQRNRKKYYKELFISQKALAESEERYRATLFSVGDAVIATDALGMVSIMNPTAEALTGYSLDEAKGRPLTQVFRIVNEETRNTVENPVDKVIREGRVVNLANHTLLIAKDGTEHPIADSGAPIRDTNGNLAGVVLVFRDQSLERQAEKCLLESEEKYRLIVETSNEGIWTIDKNYKTNFVNSSTLRMMGYSAGEMLGREAVEFMFPEDAEDYANKLGNRRAGKSERFERRFRRKNGDALWVLVSVAPNLDEQGNYAGSFSMITDITDRKRIEDSLKESERFARATLDGLSSGIAIIDKNGTLETVNESWRKFAIENNAVLQKVMEGANYLDVCDAAQGLDSAGAKEFAQGIRDVLAGTTDEYIQEYACHSTLENRWFIGRVTQFPGEGEKRAVIAHENITVRKHAEEALKTREAFLQNIFDILPIGLWYADKDGKLLRGNPAGVRIWGAEPKVSIAEYRMFKARRLPGGEEIEADDWALARTVREGATIIDELLEIDAFDGQKKIILNSTAPVRDDQDRIQGAIVINQEITDRKRAEDSLRQKSAVDSALAEIAAAMLKPDAKMADVAFTVLRHSRFLTRSRHGYAASIEPLKGDMTVHTNAAMLGRECQTKGEDARLVFHRGPDGFYPGLWGESLNTQKPFLTNNPSSHPKAAGLPQGHVPLSNFLSVPVVAEDIVLGQIALANASGNYSEEELEAIRRIAELYGMFLRDQRAKENLKRSEDQLRQAQKMEAVGQLAGGVAHDFNNMLQVILGNTGVALEDAGEESSLYECLMEIKTAANRSKDLTRQLLAFARKQTIAPKVMNLNDTVEKMLKMLRRLVGEDIDLLWKPAHGLNMVKMDPSQLDQILANLLVNAKDAISGVGKVTIETKNKYFDEEYCAMNAGFVPGHYVMLAVSDNGCGMDKDTLAKIFEPFYTTKETGRGTGLGLSTVYGIVRQNSGFINVYSEPEKGTTFKIYLPVEEAIDTEEDLAAESAKATGGNETLMLVEDEGALLKLVKKLLEKLGYTVLTATSPVKALQLAREYGQLIHLLVTDVVMPEMSGRDLWKSFDELRPGVKCLYMSGYTANVIAHHGILDEGVQFIQKPFSVDEIAKKVREVLDS